MADYSILLAHKLEPVNNEALVVAVHSMVTNTLYDFELLLDTTTPADPYTVWNRLAKQASTDWLLFTNSDVFFADGFDEPLLAAAKPDTIVTGVLVECGAIGVNTANVERNFGMTPRSYRPDEFQAWVNQHKHEHFPGDGWYMPCLIHRQTFLDMEGFPIERGSFPNPLDIWFWDDWRASGKRVQRVNSFAYHIQNWSNVNEQQKAVRFNK